MKKIAIAILVVLAALCLCSCASSSSTAKVSYPRIYTIDDASLDAVIKNQIKNVPASSVAALGGEEELEKAIRSQIPSGFLTITLINETRCSMMVTLNSSTNVLEGTIKDGVLIFQIGDTKDVYNISRNMKTLEGNWYGVDVVLVYDET